MNSSPNVAGRVQRGWIALAYSCTATLPTTSGQWHTAMGSACGLILANQVSFTSPKNRLRLRLRRCSRCLERNREARVNSVANDDAECTAPAGVVEEQQVP